MTSKIKAISSAYSRLRISGITVNPTAGHITTALERLEDMMAELQDNRGICLGYNFEDAPDVNSEMGVERSVNNMINSNLAVRMAPDFAKNVPERLMADAVQSLSAISGRSLRESIREVQPSRRMPLGSGNQHRERYQRYNLPSLLPKIECASNKINIGEINDYVENFHAYLKGELIQSFTIEVTAGMNIESSSNTDTDVNYTIKALSPSIRVPLQSVLITVTTDANRIEIRKIDFLLSDLKLGTN